MARFNSFQAISGEVVSRLITAEEAKNAHSYLHESASGAQLNINKRIQRR